MAPTRCNRDSASIAKRKLVKENVSANKYILTNKKSGLLPLFCFYNIIYGLDCVTKMDTTPVTPPTNRISPIRDTAVLLTST